MTTATLQGVPIRRPRRRRRLGRVVAVVILLIGLLITFMPYAWILFTAFKLPVDANAVPPNIFSPYTLINFQHLLAGSFPGSVWVSVVITTVSTIPTLIIGVPAGYALSRGRFRTGRLLGGWLLFSRLIPSVVFILPMYLFFHLLGLINTFQGLALAYMTGLLPFTIWLMAGYFADIPVDLEEAARVDGASRLQTFLRIDLPLAVPGIVTIGLLVSIGAWNEYFGPLILGGPDTTPATVGLQTYVGESFLDLGQVAAGSLVLVLPILILTLFTQRGLLRGLTAGAVKG
jgi:multiple sugar transport system permease protein